MKRFFGLLIFITVSAHAAPAIIDGPDGRAEVLSNPRAARLAPSVAVMVSPVYYSIATPSGGQNSTASAQPGAQKKLNLNFPIVGSPDGIGLCPDQAFSDDPTAVLACTGFLIAPDLLVTAGHCMLNFGEAHHEVTPQGAEFSWLFDYRYDAQGSLKMWGLPTDKLVGCKEVIYAIHNPEWVAATESYIPKQDFALVRLARKMAGRAPLTLATRPVHVGEDLTMISYPFGMPEKVTTGAQVKYIDNPDYFRSDLDAMGGDSGAPVFNKDWQVAGILVRRFPDPDFTDSPTHQCEVYTHCSGVGCTDQEPQSAAYTGAHAQRIAPVEALLNQ